MIHRRGALLGQRVGVVRRWVALVLLALAVILAPAISAPRPALGEDADLPDGVFQILTITREGKGVSAGTAFFIDPDGMALTNSHVVYRAFHDPDHYALLAIVAKEFYGANIVCASTLGSDPTLNSTGPLGRDIAEIQLAASTFPFTRWGVMLPGHDSPEVLATAHTAPLPSFPVLTLGDDPREGERIRVIGFGRLSERPEMWAAMGTVTKTTTAGDGTPIFQIDSPNRPKPGNSGSPVLDDQNRVVGMYTWNEISNEALGFAISRSALVHACP